MTTSYDNDQMDEVCSWIHDERRCVTTQTVSLTMSIPRSVAASLLRDLPQYKSLPGAIYEYTKCCASQEDTSMVIHLVKSTLRADEKVDTSDGPVYSLALAGTETVHTAHEKDMVTLREMLQSEESAQQALDSSLHCHDIVPSLVEQVQRMDVNVSRQQRKTVAAPKAPTKVTSRPLPQTTTTTAASFFSSKPTSSQNNHKPAVTTKNETKKYDPPPKRPTSKAKQLVKKREEYVVDVDDSDDATVEYLQAEKENTGNAPEHVMPLKNGEGNADDFIGDDDEDDDFLASEVERKRRNDLIATRDDKKTKVPERPPRRIVPKQEPETEEEEDEEEQRNEPKLTGSMDNFAGSRQRKRRKRLIESTTMDANGYLHTETKAVWEDVPTDEETEMETKASKAVTPSTRKAPPPKAAQNKNTKSMKQGNLMGFFKKK